MFLRSVAGRGGAQCRRLATAIHRRRDAARKLRVAGESEGDLSLTERIEEVERWYAARGLRASFQLGPLAGPDGLDAELERRGYGLEAPVSVQIARAGQVASPSPGVCVRVDRSLSSAWFDLSAHRGRFAACADTYRGLLGRVGAGARYALAEVDGQPAAVGLGVVDGEWTGIFSMLTLAPARRRRAGRAILAALAASAIEAHAESLYLQVERDNAPARALYRAASFDELYGYHYRVAPL
jgi:ribosomal protein S18 acetylase RimI-like enzyme